MNLRDTLLASEYSLIRSENTIENVNEELMELQCAQEALCDLTIEYREAERLHELAIQVDVLGQVCGCVKEGSKVELALIESATEIALIGTGIKSDDVIPNLEGYEGQTVGLENRLKEFAMRIWRAITRMARKIWGYVMRFYYSIFRSIPKLRKSAEDLKEKCDKVTDKTQSNDKIEMKSATETLSVDWESITSMTDIKERIEFYSQFSGAFLGEYTNAIVKKGEQLKTRLDDQTIKNADSIVTIASHMTLIKNPLKEVIEKSKYKISSSEFAKDERFNEKSSYTNPIGIKIYQSKYFVTDLITDQETRQKMADKKYESLEGNDKLSVANNVLEMVVKPKTEIFMAYSSSNKPKAPKDEKIEPINSYEIKNIADSILVMCDSLELNCSKESMKEIEKVRYEIEKVTMKMAKAADKEEMKSNAMSSAWRLIAGLNSTWAAMVSKPQTQWTSHAFAVSRAAIDLCNKALGQYK